MLENKAIIDLVTWLVAAGLFGWLGNYLMQRLQNKAARDTLEKESSVQIEIHRNNLTFELLEAARNEIQELRGEIGRLRPFEKHLLLFDQALFHLEKLLSVETEEERIKVENEARQFLINVRNL